MLVILQNDDDDGDDEGHDDSRPIVHRRGSLQHFAYRVFCKTYQDLRDS